MRRRRAVQHELEQPIQQTGDDCAGDQAAEQPIAATAQDREHHGSTGDDQDELDHADEETAGRGPRLDARDQRGVLAEKAVSEDGDHHQRDNEENRTADQTYGVSRMSISRAARHE